MVGKNAFGKKRLIGNMFIFIFSLNWLFLFL